MTALVLVLIQEMPAVGRLPVAALLTAGAARLFAKGGADVPEYEQVPERCDPAEQHWYEVRFEEMRMTHPDVLELEWDNNGADRAQGAGRRAFVWTAAVVAAWILSPLVVLGFGAAIAVSAWEKVRGIAARRRERGKMT